MAAWRPMAVNDVASLLRVADLVHPGLPERAIVFAERVKLFPDGCMVLAESNSGLICGYAISHPICTGQPPALDSLLGEIKPGADQYYIHDVAILPAFRGSGRAAEIILKLLATAEANGYASTCLVSVYGTVAFWARFGFQSVTIDELLTEKLHHYGDDATYLLRRNNV